MLNHILLGFSISFMGSLPLGVLNLTAMEVAVSKRFYQVFFFALGVIMIEYGQAYIAIRFSDYMLSNPSIEYAIKILVIPLFFIIGILYIVSGYRKREKQKKGIEKNKIIEKEITPFFKGIMLSMINPLAIPYWLAISTSLKAANKLIYDWQYIHSFIGGLVVGTFTVLTLYGALGEVLETKLKKVERYFNFIIGMILISLAIIQIYKVFVM